MSTPTPAAARIGRPRVYPDRLNDYFKIRLADAQRREIERRAHEAGQPLAVYARTILLAAGTAQPTA